ncbi:LacI family DNA-binding transcriptional regulator [Dyella marensis]|nr:MULTISPECIES: LacI family DNA-binding transcriptional regulator [Dyella]
MRRPTIKDVASLAGVSPMTVSRVINLEPTVHADTVQKVRRAIETLHYRPDATARSLRGTRSFTIALVYDDNPNANYILSLQNGVLGACREHGYELLIYPCDPRSPRLTDELSLLAKNARLAGLVLTPPMSENARLLARLKANDVAYARIIAARGDPKDGAACVYVDDHKAAYAITAYLIQLGHTAIAFLWGDPHYRSSPERYEGYADAMKEHGIPVRKKYVLEGTYTFEDGFRRARKLLAGKDAPSAIFGSNDEIAAGALAAARSAGLDVPWDLSIAGFEDNPFSRQAWPALTTASQSTSEIGRHAASRLLEQLQKGALPGSERFVPELVIRGSTAPPRASRKSRAATATGP